MIPSKVTASRSKQSKVNIHKANGGVEAIKSITDQLDEVMSTYNGRFSLSGMDRFPTHLIAADFHIFDYLRPIAQSIPIALLFQIYRMIKANSTLIAKSHTIPLMFSKKSTIQNLLGGLIPICFSSRRDSIYMNNLIVFPCIDSANYLL